MPKAYLPLQVCGEDPFGESHGRIVSAIKLEKSQSLIGKSTINGPFSIAILNYQRVTNNKVVSNKDVLKPSTNGIYIIGYSGISSRFIQHYRV